MANTRKIFNAKKFKHQCIVIDASVLLKAFLPGEDSKAVDKLLEMQFQRELTILATPLLVFEFLNTITKKMVKTEDMETAFSKFRRLSIGVIHPEHAHIKAMMKELAQYPSVSYYDASYHALAKDMDATFITADKKYYDTMKHLGHVELFA